MAPIMSFATVISRPGFSGYCIGPYHILDALSTGPLNSRYLVKHVLTDNLYTLKVIDMCYLRDDVSLDGSVIFQMERVRNLSHPNLVSVHEVLASTTHVFVVSEVAIGVRFLDTVQNCNNPLREDIARMIFRQLVDVISFCHSYGVYHREISEETIILTSSGELKVSDAGINFLKDDNNYRLPSNSWSLHFTAPEVWASSQNAYDGSRADAFSLGVVLFVLLTGIRPFDDERELEVLRNVHNCRVSYPKHLSNRAVDLLRYLLERNPGKRWNLDLVKVHPWYLNIEEFPVTPVIEYSFPKYSYSGIYGNNVFPSFSSDFQAARNTRSLRHTPWKSPVDPWQAAFISGKLKEPSWKY